MKISKQENILLCFLTTPCSGDCRGCEILEICNSITEYMEAKGLWSAKALYKEEDLEVVENENL